MSLITKIKSPIYSRKVKEYKSNKKLGWNPFRSKIKDMGFSIQQKSVLYKLYSNGYLLFKHLEEKEKLVLLVKRKRRRRKSPYRKVNLNIFF